jgi:exodeoxyribonuclease VII small subunit
MSDINLAEIGSMTYEQAFAGLENVVAALEKNPPTLEEALSLYERGRHLSERLAALLEQAELRVRQISDRDLDEPL